MAKPKLLTMGTDSPSPTPDEEKERIAALRATVEHYLPEFAKGVAEAARAKGEKDSTMVLHQDTFAAGYDDEYTLLGMVVKHAGLHGVIVTVTCTNHETF